MSRPKKYGATVRRSVTLDIDLVERVLKHTDNFSEAVSDALWAWLGEQGFDHLAGEEQQIIEEVNATKRRELRLIRRLDMIHQSRTAASVTKSQEDESRLRILRKYVDAGGKEDPMASRELRMWLTGPANRELIMRGRFKSADEALAWCRQQVGE